MMCCCEQPNVNGTPGYRWRHDEAPSVYPVRAPALAADDELLVDAPGRCGGIDAHSHHFRLVTRRNRGMTLLVRHGGGDEAITLSASARVAVNAILALSSNDRYWLLHAIYGTQRESAQAAREATAATWQRAAAEKRIKTRRNNRRGTCKVWIEATPAKIGGAT